MSFIEELTWRGMLHDATPGLEEHLQTGMRTAYIGFDPTAPSLTLGNYVQIMLLTLFQRAGHKPIVLMGGATGRIGDPSGRDSERELKTYEELDTNLRHQEVQIRKLIDFDGGNNKAELLNNFDFYRQMNVLDFLRDAGKTLTVSYMMSKESVKRRLDSGISFTEFSYQLIQAYDFQLLFSNKGCTVQMGGSDQWGNITSGTEFIRRNLSEKAYAVTTPLLTKANGEKFGKSFSGNVWLDPELTSPYQFYQFWLNADDRDIPKFTRYFTLLSRDEIETRERELANDLAQCKRLLAEELTIRIHSREAFGSVQRVSELLFSRNANAETLRAMSAEELRMVSGEIPRVEVPGDLISGGLGLLELLSEHTQIMSSKSDARRAIQGNAVSVNKERISSAEASVSAADLLHGRYMLIDNGKKNKYILEVV